MSYCLGCKDKDKRLLVCSSCHCVSFCGRECQKKVWKVHKPLCKAMAVAQTTTCLVVDGLGPLGADDFLTQAVTRTALRGIPYIVVHAYKRRMCAEQLSMVLAKLPSLKSLIILGWGGGCTELAKEFGDSFSLRESVVTWVEKGGRLFVHGEGIRIWRSWFDLPWEDGDYFRTAYARNPNHWATWFLQSPDAPKVMNVKACSLSKVAPTDILFGTDDNSRTISLVPFMSNQEMRSNQSPFTLARFGEGTVSFFGDVNAEDVTMNVISMILKH